MLLPELEYRLPCHSRSWRHVFLGDAVGVIVRQAIGASDQEHAGGSHMLDSVAAFFC
jgi:hypothetical protein